MQNFFNTWTRRALLNLLIVALAGTLLRCKIIWEIPVLDYKNLMHAHSHFAFSGWVSLALSVAIAGVMQLPEQRLRVYQQAFWFLLLSAFGMLLSFPFGGYNIVSIFFSTSSIFAGWYFAWINWKDLSTADLPITVINWFRSALVFYVISAAGPFFLAWLMASENLHQQWYIGSVYFFLHFQYNGWFAFAVIGLFLALLHRRGISFSAKAARIAFWLQCIACVPAFFLSALWMKLPPVLYWMAVLAAIAQLIALAVLLAGIIKCKKRILFSFDPIPLLLWGFALLAFCMKTIMQSLSVFPDLSYLAFGYRPVVIGYLHLILLGFITLFLLGFLLLQQYISSISSRPVIGIGCFVTGVVLNEFFLFVQALASIGGTHFSMAVWFLLFAALLMLCGISLLYISQLNNNFFKYGISSNKQREPAASTR
ncbi:hypothetical protein [Pseudobacter ginsenosidimutans]|uniref:NnrS protein n=1 Tax=Pseudobacter ginsenosidimutans TaxID=661488 RepID=A0A4Q7MNS9_9BACT|nr:hypothetical protein [Pseudobacter ginsenosidimutans]QEC45800.1 hypothetical protein FSB84_30455 [Pseudobacter ginsenosidimutans]RZS69248.1 hypothetical protein EV199_5084 [Pseudobacter ginsenosidimutans]